VSNWPKSPGCANSTIKALQLRSLGFSEKDKYVSICVDEMSLSPNLVFDRREDKIIGLEDFGNGDRSNKIASSATVFLIQGIFSKWSQLLCCFLAQGQTKSSQLHIERDTVVRQLKSIDLIPCIFICDQGRNFVSFFNSLNLNEKRTAFEVGGHKMFFMFDPPHLLKSTRNCVYNHKNVGFFYK